MRARVNLGRVWDIPIGLHPSWFLIFGLLTWSLAVGSFPQAYPELSTASYWLLGALTGISFFGSVLAHELAHAFFALRNRIPVRGITLFIFGGVAQIGGEPRSPGAEFRIAIAGPLASLGLAALFGSLGLLVRGIPFLAGPSLWLARTNLALALFNMIPGFPLDGGRVLRALIWRFTGSFRRATQVATSAGQLTAWGFIGVGVFTVVSGLPFNGLWLALIGWFLQNAAASSRARSNMQRTLSGVTVGEVMGRDCPRVPSLTPLSQLVETWVLNGGQSCFFVMQDGRLLGLLTMRDITAVPQRKWRYVTAGEVMVPFERLARVRPDAQLVEALQEMDDADVEQVPVVEDNEIVGLLSRERVLRYFRLRAELGV